jgi:hypothetical protein
MAGTTMTTRQHDDDGDGIEALCWGWRQRDASDGRR